MKKYLCYLLFLLHLSTFGQISRGNIHHLGKFPSKYITERNVEVWLPSNYTTSQKYEVVYMHDGQMLFDSTTTWNHQEWGVDEVVDDAIQHQKIKPCIVVAIWNVPEIRYADYFPQKVVYQLPNNARKVVLMKQMKGEFHADNYLKFIVEELKPYIDAHFSTYTTAKHTFLMGSSMGGLISLYGLCEYPKVFGGAACLSIHSPMISPALIQDSTVNIDADIAAKFRDYLTTHLPKKNTCKIYMDYGDATLDAYYEPYQKKIDAVLAQKGYTSHYWQTRFFAGENHSEKAWQKRLIIPFCFLLGKEVK